MEPVIVDVVKTKYVYSRINELDSTELEEFIKIKDSISSQMDYDRDKLDNLYKDLRNREVA